MSYDPKCAELAAEFLSDEGLDDETHIDQLAQIIQAAIEDYLNALTDVD